MTTAKEYRIEPFITPDSLLTDKEFKLVDIFSDFYEVNQELKKEKLKGRLLSDVSLISFELSYKCLR
jgi:hypothetical protein